MSRPIETRLPVFVPHAIRGRVRARPAYARSVDSLTGMERLAIDVRDGEVRHVKVAHRPARWVLGVFIHTDAEKGQLIAETVTARGFDIAGVVPPLDSVLIVRGVIVRERVLVACFGLKPCLGLSIVVAASNWSLYGSDFGFWILDFGLG